MVLEQSDKQTNLKNITIEAPEARGIPFDAKQEITSQDWEEIMSGFSLRWKSEDNYGGLEILHALAILSPEKVNALHLRDDDYRHLIKVSRTPTPGKSSYTAREMAIKMLFPDKFKKTLTDKEWQEIMKESMRLKGTLFRREQLPVLADLKLLYPDRFETVELGSEDLTVLQLDINYQRYGEPPLKEYWPKLNYAQRLYALKVLWPEEFAQSAIDWQFLREGLAEVKKGDFKATEYPRLLSYMHLLTCDISVTPDTIKVLPGAKLINQEQPLPEMRKF